MSTHTNIVNAGSEFFKKEFHQLRPNFVVDILFSIGMTVAIFSGLPIPDDDFAQAGIYVNIGAD